MEDTAHRHPGLTPQVLQQELDGRAPEERANVQRQLQLGVPLAYALRSRFFYRAEFHVDQRVLIPRMESELMLQILRDRWRGHYRTLVDVGTGSGCLGLSCAMEFSRLRRVILTDNSPTAVQVAALNREKLRYRLPPHCQIELRHGHCLEEIPRADIVIANPPYIADTDRVHPQVLQYEPHSALFPQGDYWDWYRNFFARITEALSRGGVLAMEGESEYLPELATLLNAPKWELLRDLTGRTRFLWAEF